MKQISPALVRKTITVRSGIERAFTVFTQEIGRWWLKSHTINQSAPQKDVIIEPYPMGRWYELGVDARSASGVTCSNGIRPGVSCLPGSSMPIGDSTRRS